MVDFDDDARLDSSQIEDRRGRRGVPRGRGGLAVGGGGLGIIGVILALLLGGGVLGGGGGDGGLGGLAGLDDTAIGPGAGGATPGEVQQECRTGADADTREDCRILAFINDVQAYWRREFRELGETYRPATTVLFSGSTQSACGPATEQTGPFYCPADRKIYLDLGFFRTLQDQFGARGGPFAQAYVIAHEYGHHVQNLLGILEQVQRDRRTGPQSAAVRAELQADCFAGAWAANAGRGVIGFRVTQREITDALDAAAAVGDDRIQEAFQGRVIPESWTHGSSEQRRSWFTAGLRAAGPQACNTFQGRV